MQANDSLYARFTNIPEVQQLQVQQLLWPVLAINLGQIERNEAEQIIGSDLIDENRVCAMLHFIILEYY